MKKNLLLCMLLFASLLSANLKLEEKRGNLFVEGNIEIQLDNRTLINGEVFTTISSENLKNSGTVGQVELPIFSQMVELPNRGNYKIVDLSYDIEEIELENGLYLLGEKKDQNISYFQKNEMMPKSIAFVSKPSIMRGTRFSQIVINPVQYNPIQKKIRIFRNISVELELDESIDTNVLTPKNNLTKNNFSKLYSQNLYGYEQNRNLEVETPLYLFICPDDRIDDIEPLASWKRQLGFKTKIAGLSETGNSNTEILAYLQNGYDNWDIAPEFVVLVGDESGTISVPSFFIEAYLHPYAVSDHPYSLLEGDDYFPDVMVGRLSCRNAIELNTIIQKIINYEKEPYTEIDWFTRALALSVIEPYSNYFSGRETVMAARKKLLDFTYTVVDTFISPYQTSSSQLIGLINEGCTFINYRGFGSPYYWSGSYGAMFHINQISQLNNGTMMPMITSIVCGGGDFASNDYDTCFGEKWVNVGTPSNPKGAIAFIGPSEYDTKTQFNNTNDLGIYQGITEENLFGSAEMMLRGKMELYNSYPNNHDMDGSNDALDSDQFYFYVYNLLGDPGLKIWTDVPNSIDLTSPTEIDGGINNLDITIDSESPENTLMAFTSEGQLISSCISDALGNATLILPYLEAGEYKITASKYGSVPQINDITVTESELIILENLDISEIWPNTNPNLNITLHNLSSEDIFGCSVKVISEDNYIYSDEAVLNFDLPAGASTQLSTDITFAADWRNGEIFELIVELTYNDETFQQIKQLEMLSPEIVVSDIIIENAEAAFIQGETNNFKLELQNVGQLDSNPFELQITALSDNFTIGNNLENFQEIAINDVGIGENSFSVTINDDVITGEIIAFLAEVIVNDEIISELTIIIPVGNVTAESPTFGANGYYAIESSDVGNFEAPVYNWFPISPDEGGEGVEMQAIHSTTDGKVGWVDLPFDFIYFDKAYNTITISTEGYLSMGHDELIFFRNRNIPSAVGADAMIAPFWDNLKNGNIYTYYDEPNHLFIISWVGFISSYNYSPEEFQIVLFDPEFYNTDSENGQILFQYKEISNCDYGENYATIGIENEAQSDGLLLTYANIYPETMHELADETAILITCGELFEVDLSDEEIEVATTKLFNYPNPFQPSNSERNSATTISFSTTEKEKKAEIAIYNIKGQKIRSLLNTKLDSGNHSVIWNGTDEFGNIVTSGIYLYKLNIDGKTQQVEKCLILK